MCTIIELPSLTVVCKIGGGGGGGGGWGGGGGGGEGGLIYMHIKGN